ncbi:hypothetical protein [Streptomyces sp. NPDC058457]|uniref:hypothetical protein n=1 Tax=Streptomyces sp. NPDC058457 TaxID=3346507 RepID=UPI003662A9D8
MLSAESTGLVRATLPAVAGGDELLSTPFGDVFLDDPVDTTTPVVLVSAGIGCTPMTGILGHLAGLRSIRRVLVGTCAGGCCAPAFPRDASVTRCSAPTCGCRDPRSEPSHRSALPSSSVPDFRGETRMTTNNSQATPSVGLRSDGAVDEETLAYARAKIDAVVSRPGLPAVTGEVRILRAVAHHAGHPWSASANLRIGGRQVVVTATEEATGAEVVDRLQDRLRCQTDRAAQAWHDARRTTTPPWRGGPTRSAGPNTTDAAEGSRPA